MRLDATAIDRPALVNNHSLPLLLTHSTPHTRPSPDTCSSSDPDVRLPAPMDLGLP